MAKSGSDYALNKLAKLEPENARLKKTIHSVRCELALANRQIESLKFQVESLQCEARVYRTELSIA